MARMLLYFIASALVLLCQCYTALCANPLYLTPLIEKGDYRKAKVEARVRSTLIPRSLTTIESYSGYITVNKTTGSNMFFWFIASTTAPSTSQPTMVWLQGGPGASSMFGIFSEHGPWRADKHGQLHLRDKGMAWTEFANMLYIDNPVGTGFSFTEKDAGFAATEADVGHDLVTFTEQFTLLFSEYFSQKQPFFIAGESYAGKYVPAFGAALMHAQATSPTLKAVNFKGVLIGDGYSDPVTMSRVTGDVLYNFAMLNDLERRYFNQQTEEMIFMAQEGAKDTAFAIGDRLIDGDIFPYKTFFENATGCSNYFNYRQCVLPEELGYFGVAMNNGTMKAAIHVGDRAFNDGNTTVETALLPDFMEDVKHEVETLLAAMPDFKVMFYSGSLDVIVPTVGTLEFLRSTSIGGRLAAAERKPFRVAGSGEMVSGYVTDAGSFRFAVVSNSGHMVPYDRPLVAYHLAKTFVTQL